MSDVKEPLAENELDRTIAINPIDKTVVVPATVSNERTVALAGDSTAQERTLNAHEESITKCTSVDSVIGLGATLKDRFFLDSVLGVGGMGTVYRAKDLRQEEVGEKDPWLAIKILNSNISQHAFSWGALQRECKKTQLLSHPNIVSVFDFDRDGDTLFMSMELLDGVPLDEVINKPSFSGWPQEKIDKLVSQVGGALTYAHSQGIVHSDLKPSNIFLTKGGDFKVYDFGIARAVHDVSAGDAGGKDEPLVALTPAYASVGMLRDEKATPADDLYAFGCVINIAASAEHPYRRKTALEALESNMRLASAKFSDLHKSDALDAILSVSEPLELSAQQFMDRFLVKPKRSPIYAALGGALFLLLITFVGIYLLGHSERVLLSDLQSEDRELFAKAIDAVDTMAEEERDQFLESSSGELIGYFESRAKRFSAGADYFSALRVVREVQGLYPDSMRISALSQQLTLKQNSMRERLIERVRSIKSSASQQLNDRLQELPNLLESARKIEGGKELLQQWALDLWLARKMSESIYVGDAELVSSLFQLAEEIFPSDERFMRIYQEYQSSSAGDTGSDNTVSNWHNLEEIDQLWAAHEVGVQSIRSNSWAAADSMQFLNSPAVSTSAWGRALKGGMRAFVERQYDLYTQPGSTNDRVVAKAYKSLGHQMYPDEGLFQTQKRIVDPCQSWWAGKGRLDRYQCRDSITSRLKGPLLVVIPRKIGLRSFAIMRYEVSNNLYKRYCELYKRCNRRFIDKSLVLSGVDIREAKRFAQWVTTMTGFVYRLPRLEEWRHAVSANGTQQINDHNCLLTHGNKVIRGMELRKPTKGSANAWGVKNGLGNVSEWVVLDRGVGVSGGNAMTPLADCRISHLDVGEKIEREMAGIRLVRELR
ncbi:hypothetical protein A9Q99_02310 [Gammaproteobacteria bacterium 45_16_T64]|nr:hypothetical protein A9Q99_02310 [Gammaproteobacteria bacterium 45_16_T64]